MKKIISWMFVILVLIISVNAITLDELKEIHGDDVFIEDRGDVFIVYQIDGEVIIYQKEGVEVVAEAPEDIIEEELEEEIDSFEYEIVDKRFDGIVVRESEDFFNLQSYNYNEFQVLGEEYYIFILGHPSIDKDFILSLKADEEYYLDSFDNRFSLGYNSLYGDGECSKVFLKDLDSGRGIKTLVCKEESISEENVLIRDRIISLQPLSKDQVREGFASIDGKAVSLDVACMDSVSVVPGISVPEGLDIEGGNWCLDNLGFVENSRCNLEGAKCEREGEIGSLIEGLSGSEGISAEIAASGLCQGDFEEDLGYEGEPISGESLGDSGVTEIPIFSLVGEGEVGDSGGEELGSLKIDFDEIWLSLNPPLDTSHIKTNDVLCASYGEGFDSTTGSFIKKITGLITDESGCQITLGYSDGYLEREGDIDIENKLLGMQSLIRDRFRPLKVDGVKVYLTTKEEIQEIKGEHVEAYYDFSSNEIFIDENSPTFVFYHEFVHAFQNQLEKNYIPEINSYTSNNELIVANLFESLFEEDIPKTFLQMNHPKEYSVSMTNDDAMNFIADSDLIDGFLESPEVVYKFINAFFRYDFVPEYEGFFETLDFCNGKIIARDGVVAWSDEDELYVPKHGAYASPQCEDISEFTAYLMQDIKFAPYKVFQSINGEFGDKDRYKENLDLALEQNWITQEDYDRVVNYGEQGDLDLEGEILETCSVELDNTRVFSNEVFKSFETMKENAKMELAENGITREQRKAYIPCVSEFLYEGITPSNYYSIGPVVSNFIDNLGSDREDASNIQEDAWRFYLGLPQQYNSFEISDYRPSQSKENIYYYKAPYITKSLKQSKEAPIEDNSNKINFDFDLGETIATKNNKGETTFFGSYSFKGLILDAMSKGGTTFRADFYSSSNTEGSLGTFKFSLGQDEKGNYLSYYDLWDLGGNVIEGEDGFFGKPFEVYDRIYYNPETFEIIEPEEEVGDSGGEEFGCDAKEPTIGAKIAKAFKQALNVGDEREFCEVGESRDQGGLDLFDGNAILDITGNVVEDVLGNVCSIDLDPTKESSYEKYAKSIFSRMKDQIYEENGETKRFSRTTENIDLILSHIQKNPELYGAWNIVKLRSQLYSLLKRDLGRGILKGISDSYPRAETILFVAEGQDEEWETGRIFVTGQEALLPTKDEYRFRSSLYDNAGRARLELIREGEVINSLFVDNSNFWKYFSNVENRKTPNWRNVLDEWNDDYYHLPGTKRFPPSGRQERLYLTEGKEFSQIYVEGHPRGGFTDNEFRRQAAIILEAMKRGTKEDIDRLKKLSCQRRFIFKYTDGDCEAGEIVNWEETAKILTYKD